MSSHFAGRIKAAKLFQGVYTGNIQVEYLLAMLRCKAAGQVDKLTVSSLLQALAQPAGFLPQRLGQHWPLIAHGLQFASVTPYGRHRRAYGQRLTVAIGNHPTVRRDRDVPHTACIALTLQKIVIEHMQVNNLPAQHADHQDEQKQHKAEPAVLEYSPQEIHGVTSRTSAASGMRIFNRSLAKASIRLCAIQVLCSNTRRPHSACILSRSCNSPYRSLTNCRLRCAEYVTAIADASTATNTITSSSPPPGIDLVAKWLTAPSPPRA